MHGAGEHGLFRETSGSLTLPEAEVDSQTLGLKVNGALDCDRIVFDRG